jgi:excisionase family DNA binding protein
MILVEQDRTTTSADSEPPIEPLVVSVKNAAVILDAGVSTIWELLARGELDAVKDGGRTKITMESIKRRLANLPRATFKVAAPRRRRLDAG